jgi:lipopolysaccharide transport system ATP-binding protein
MQKRTARELNDINENKSYGTYEVEITQVDILGLNHLNQSVFYAGDYIEFAVKCICHVDLNNLNVAYRILTKEGVKVTTWGTLNEDMPYFSNDNEQTFWHKKFQKGQEFEVRFKGKCNLGANLYELQVVVAREHDQYYANQQVLHWLDEAGHFTVILKAKEYVFDGVCDMGLRSQTSALDRTSVQPDAGNTW